MALLFSCGAEETAKADGGKPDAIPGQENEAEEEESVEAAGGKLPFEPVLMDLGGRKFTFGDCGWGAEVTSEQRCVLAEEITGEPINDSVFERNAKVEEMFNCVVAEMKYSDPGQLLSGLRKSITAGDGQFDAAYIRLSGHLGPLASSSALYDLNQLPNIDLTQPWWDQNILNQTSIAGRVFAANGDIQILDKGAINAFVFNKQLQADYQSENFYGLVKDGQWTFEKMLEIARQISVDLNGDGKMDDNDRYGLLYYRDSIPAFLTATDSYIASKDDEDMPIMTFNTEKVYSALDTIYEVIYDESVAYHTMRAFGDSGFIIEGNRMFQNSQALLMYVRMTEIEGLRGMDTDFGILPFPKYDTNQEKYYSLVNASIGSALVVPVTVNPEETGALLDAMAYTSRYTLIPAYYEVTLKGKISRDDDSEAMLNIIFSNMTYDLGGVYDFGGIVGELMYHTMTFKRTMASFYEKNEPRALRDIDKLVTSILGD